MKAKILDSFKEGDNTCYLVDIKLNDYITSLPDDYKEFEIQREIVNNTYLDNLIDTILNKKHIPIIVIVSDDDIKIKGTEIDLKDFKILDGLQRTFRLKVIFETINFFIKKLEKSEGFLEYSKLQLSKHYKAELEEIQSSTILLNKLIEFYKNSPSKKNLTDLFNRNQWFELWTSLSPEDEVNKMLILNAGHKPVKTKHQLELLFRTIIPVFKKVDFPDFEIIREKEVSSTTYSKYRTVGQFHFSHLITAILSFGETKPITSNISLIQKAQDEQLSDKKAYELFQYTFLKEFVSTLMKLDKKSTSEFDDLGTKWIGRETTLVGIFAAIGKYCSEKSLKPVDALKEFNTRIIDNIAILSLNEFEEYRNSLNIQKVNIGSVSKKAVFNGVYNFMIGSSKRINWEKVFEGEKL